MSTSEYSPVTWSDGDPLDTVKLQQMVDNTRLLYERTPTFKVNSHGVIKESGLRVLATTLQFPRTTSDSQWQSLYFGNFFSPGCRPVISLGYNVGPHKRMYATFNGLGSNSHWPDHRGIDIIVVSHHTAGFKYVTNVNVIAIGW